MKGEGAKIPKILTTWFMNDLSYVISKIGNSSFIIFVKIFMRALYATTINNETSPNNR